MEPEFTVTNKYTMFNVKNRLLLHQIPELKFNQGPHITILYVPLNENVLFQSYFLRLFFFFFRETFIDMTCAVYSVCVCIGVYSNKVTVCQ